MPIQLVIFDMDGVIFEGDNFWLDLHKLYGTQEAGVKLAESYIQNDYLFLANSVAGGLWKGRRAEPYWKLVQERAYQKGIKQLFAFLRDRHILSAIVSTGPYDLADRARHELSINEIRANRLEIADGVLTGKVEVQVEERHKSSQGLEVMSVLKVGPENTACVGDSASDEDLAKIVSLPIAYNAKSVNLEKISRYNLAYGHIGDIIKILDKT